MELTPSLLLRRRPVGAQLRSRHAGEQLLAQRPGRPRRRQEEEEEDQSQEGEEDQSQEGVGGGPGEEEQEEGLRSPEVGRDYVGLLVTSCTRLSPFLSRS